MLCVRCLAFPMTRLNIDGTIILKIYRVAVVFECTWAVMGFITADILSTMQKFNSYRLSKEYYPFPDGDEILPLG